MVSFLDMRLSHTEVIFAVMVLAAIGVSGLYGEAVKKQVVEGEHRQQPFAVVFIDERTEKALGPFPYDRAVLARGINRIAELKARAVILKFFIDRPKSGDRALADALKRVKVVLQARLDDDEKMPNLLPDKFTLVNLATDRSPLLSAGGGWIPLPALSEVAHDVGFIDSIRLDRVTMVERYRGAAVKSLYTCALELAFEEKAEVVPGKFVKIGQRKLVLGELSQVPIEFPEQDKLEYFSFVDLLNGKVPAEAIKDRVVILGYDGAKMEASKIPAGEVKGHRVFCYQLFSVYDQMAGQVEATKR